jgi:hypothetical protein
LSPLSNYIMKLFIYLFCLFTISVVAQNSTDSDNSQIVIAEFYVKDVRFDGVDYSKDALLENNKLFFYRSTDGKEVLFSNYWEKDDTQSYGPISNITYKHYKPTDEFYEIDEYKFLWSYVNSYDDKEGTCEATLKLEHKPQGIFFDLKMYSESLEELYFRGEFKGSMDFVKYLVDKY